MRIALRIGQITAVMLLLLIAASPDKHSARAAAQPPSQVTTLAGSGDGGVVDGPSTTAQFAQPLGIAVDATGTAYVVDAGRIRRISPTGDVLTIAGGEATGFADGPGTVARFEGPFGIAVDTPGNLYIADRGNHRIRKLSPLGVVTTLAGTGVPGLADGPADQAQFNTPTGVAVDASGTVYVVDTLNYRIRRISPDGIVTTLAGGGDIGPDVGDYADGPASTARFAFATGLAVDPFGTVYVADTYNARIRAVSPQGDVTTIAGSGEDGGRDGPALQAQFSDPAAVVVDSAGALYVVDKSNRVRLITPTGIVTTLAGAGAQGYADGPTPSAEFDQPQGIAVGPTGAVYIADTGNRRIRLISAPP